MRFLNRLSLSSKLFIGLMALYAALTFILPANPTSLSTYQLSEMQYRYLLFIVKIPVIAAWSIAFYSYRKLRQYATQIKDSPEGNDYDAMAKGTGWLAWGFAVPPIISAFFASIILSHPGFTTFAISFSTYVYLIVTIVALSYINAGIHRLARRSSITFGSKHMRYLVAILVVLSVLFCMLIASRLQDVTDMANSFNSFYIPNGLVWITIVMPYLYAWCLGIIGAFELILVARRTSGVIYKQALQYLAIGLVVIIVTMCALQYFRAIIPRTGSLAINGALITAYAIYAINAIGSVLLATGVKRLKRIEDI